MLPWLNPAALSTACCMYTSHHFCLVDTKRCEQYAEALERCVRSGLTAVHSNDENAIEVYARLQEEGRLPLRVYLTLPHDELDKEQPVAGKGDGGSGGGAGKPKPWSGDGGLLSWNRVKLFSDGSLGTCAIYLSLLDPGSVHACRAQKPGTLGTWGLRSSRSLKRRKKNIYFPLAPLGINRVAVWFS